MESLCVEEAVEVAAALARWSLTRKAACSARSLSAAALVGSGVHRAPGPALPDLGAPGAA